MLSHISYYVALRIRSTAPEHSNVIILLCTPPWHHSGPKRATGRVPLGCERARVDSSSVTPPASPECPRQARCPRFSVAPPDEGGGKVSE